MKYWILGIGASILIAHTASLFALIFQCQPIRTFWSLLPEEEESSCIHQKALIITAGVINIIEDVVIVVLPVSWIWRLQKSRCQKITVVFLFLLEGCVCATSIARLAALEIVTLTDFSGELFSIYALMSSAHCVAKGTVAQAAIWGSVEVEVGFICANLPQCRSLLAHCIQKRQRSNQNTTTVSSKSCSRVRGFTRINSARASNRHPCNIALQALIPAIEIKQAICQEKKTINEQGKPQQIGIAITTSVSGPSK